MTELIVGTPLVWLNGTGRSYVAKIAGKPEFFAEHGERENKRRARFRHIREKLGNQDFKAELERRFAVLKALRPRPNIHPVRADRDIKRLA